MNYVIRIVIGCCVFGFIISFTICGILSVIKKDNELLEKIIEESTPFTPQKFEYLFNHSKIKVSSYGLGLQYCSLKKSHEKVIIEDDRVLVPVGTLKITESSPETWINIYHDNQNNSACYSVSTDNTEPSLICFKYKAIIDCIRELSRVCKAYSQSIGWDGLI